MSEPEFGPIFLLIIISLFGYLVVVLFEKMHQNYIPESGGWIIMGTLLGVIWGLMPFTYPYILEPNRTFHTYLYAQLTFDESVFEKIFLPIIIFEAGWSLTGHSRSVFLHSFFQIGSLAVIGTLISMFVTFGAIMILVHTHLTILNFKDALVLSALLAATDPVATLSVFARLHVHPVLNSFTFGESILNDAVAIVMFRSMLTLYEVEAITVGIGFQVAGIVLLNAVGSAVVGVVFALVGSLILKWTSQGHSPSGLWQVVLTSLLGFLTFSVADLALSGVVSVFVFAIFARHYMFFLLPAQTQVFIDDFFKVVKEFCEMLVFLLLGMQIVWYKTHDYSFALIGVVFVSLIVGRFLHVFALGRCFNLARRPETRLTWGMQLLLAWSGLRGAVAFSLSLTTPKGFNFDAPTNINENDYPISETLSLDCTCDTSPVTAELHAELQRQSDVHGLLVTTTLVQVFLTIFIFGGLTSTLLSMLGLSGIDNLPSSEVLESRYLRPTRSEWTERFLAFDREYLIPFFSTPDGREPYHPPPSDSPPYADPLDSQEIELDSESYLLQPMRSTVVEKYGAIEQETKG